MIRQYQVKWTYDSMGRTLGIVEDPKGLNKQTYFTYDVHGNIKTKIQPSGTILVHEYDQLGRETSVYSTDGTISYVYSYNLSDQIVESIDRITQTILKRDYDTFGNLSFETFPNGAKIEYHYDGYQRTTHILLPDLSRVEYQYGPVEMESVIRLSPDGAVVYEHRYDRTDWEGKSIESTLITRQKCNFKWDQYGRYRGVNTSHASVEIPDDGYDPNGNLLKINTTGTWGTDSENYRYDETDQLVSEKGILRHEYTNDSIKNRLSKDNFKNILNSLNQIKSDGKTEYDYDSNGNLITEKGENGNIRYTYDALNRLCTVENTRKWKIKNTYDSYGRSLRTQQYRWNENNDEDEWLEEEDNFYLHQGIHEIGMMNSEGQIKQLRVMGKNENLVYRSAIAVEIENGIYAPIYNQRCDIIALVDIESGVAVESYRYSAFGICFTYDHTGTELSSSVLGNPWLYGNKRYDKFSDLTCFGARCYRASLGRWITPDPGNFIDGFNLYAYTHNHPLTCTDFFGFATCDTLHKHKEKNRSILWFINKGAKAIGCMGCSLEGFSHHVIPSSGVQYFGEAIGRILQGKSLTHVYTGKLKSVSGTVGGDAFTNCRIRYINGVMTERGVAMKDATAISDMLGGGQVFYTCSQTKGFNSDGVQMAIEYLTIPTQAIDHLRWEIIHDYHIMKKNCGEDFRLYFFLHSRGAFDFDLATRDLPKEIRDKMSVVTLGGAVELSKDDYKRAENYKNNRDFARLVSFFLTPRKRKVRVTYTGYQTKGILSFLNDHAITSKGYQEAIGFESLRILENEKKL